MPLTVVESLASLQEAFARRSHCNNKRIQNIVTWTARSTDFSNVRNTI